MVDGTRRETVEQLFELRDIVRGAVGDVSSALAQNPCTVSSKIRLRQPRRAPSRARKGRQANGKVSTHWRREAPSGNTRSIRLAAVAFIRRPRHEGQKPRPLQLNRHDPALTAVQAPEPCKASPAKDAAAEVGLELPAGVLGDAHRNRPILDRPVQRLESVAHHRVQRRRLRPMAPVDTGCWGL